MRKSHPYGWIQWYCDFYLGKRSEDDERQIKRWLGLAGKKGRFRNYLITLIKRKNSDYNDETVSPKIRQTLQQWGYKLTKKDFNLYNSDTWFFPVHTGDLIMFPSDTQHKVEYKRGNNIRTSIAFNIYIKGILGDLIKLTELKLLQKGG